MRRLASDHREPARGDELGQMPSLAAVRLVRKAICQKERTKRCASSLLLPSDVFAPFASEMGMEAGVRAVTGVLSAVSKAWH